MRRAVLILTVAALVTEPIVAREKATPDRDPLPILAGPIADFWNQVKREWAKKIPGLQSGPSQTAQWVSLVYGTEGEDEVLADMLEKEMRVWAKWQRRSWVRSEFWRKRYAELDRDGFYGSRALRQNLVVLGTARSNPMVVEMTEGTPFRLEDDRIRIGPREYHGGSLVLAFIRPNPFGGGNYALVITGTSDAALLDLQRMPMGDTDYILFRGGHRLEAGNLDWSVADDLVLAGDGDIRPDHDGWWKVSEERLAVWFDPSDVPEEAAREFARAHAARVPMVAAYFGIEDMAPLSIYLYRGVDSKILYTGQPGTVTVDLAGGAVHRVRGPGFDEATWPEAMAFLWSAWGPSDLRGLLLGLALLPDGEFEGQSLDAWAARLASLGRLQRMEDLMIPGPPWRDGEADRALQTLALSSFLSSLARERGIPALREYYREARQTGFRSAFRDVLGTSLARAEQSWRKALPTAAPAEAVAGAPPPAAEPSPAEDLLAEGRALFLDREDAAAATVLREALAMDPDLPEAHVLLARLAFRGERDDEAIAHAQEALNQGPDQAGAAWAQVTLGRAHAVREENLSARLALTDEAVERGPEAPRLLAEFWLENLGLSPNRRVAAAYLAEQAEIDLLSYDWDTAERRALQILAADPGDPDAHHLLARIRVAKFSYWFDFATLYNELFPTTTKHDPMQYYYLLQSANRESLKGAYLASGALSTLELDREKDRGRKDVIPRDLYPRVRTPEYMTPSMDEVIRGRAFLLGGDYARAASHLRAALGLVMPVSDARAWTLYLLARAEIELGEIDAARAHLEEAAEIVRKPSLRADIEGELAGLGN